MVHGMIKCAEQLLVSVGAIWKSGKVSAEKRVL